MPRYCLFISYNGHNFCGWQRQINTCSIQETIESVLQKILGEKIVLVAACRTDSGVHAFQQVATFKTAKKLDIKKIQRSMNSMLAPDICVYTISIVPESFHPIRSAQGKIYRYLIMNSSYHDPFLYPYVWLVKKKLHVSAMQQAAKTLLGKHDFTSFCATDSSAVSKIRTLLEIKIVERYPLLEIWLVGDGFLKQMVRTICGTLVEIGWGRELDIEKILLQKDRCAAGVTAPAKGLTLITVCYSRHPTIDDWLKSADSFS